MKLHSQALRAENLIAAERVTALLNDEVMFPLYRLPLRAYDAALKALLTDASDLTPDAQGADRGRAIKGSSAARCYAAWCTRSCMSRAKTIDVAHRWQACVAQWLAPDLVTS
jgi:hypothetical protein